MQNPLELDNLTTQTHSVHCSLFIRTKIPTNLDYLNQHTNQTAELDPILQQNSSTPLSDTTPVQSPSYPTNPPSNYADSSSTQIEKDSNSPK